MKLSFPIYIIHDSEKVSLYTLHEKEAKSWVRLKGESFKMKMIKIRRNKI